MLQLPEDAPGREVLPLQTTHQPRTQKVMERLLQEMPLQESQTLDRNQRRMVARMKIELKFHMWREVIGQWMMRVDNHPYVSWGDAVMGTPSDIPDTLQCLLKLNIRKRIGVESKGRVHNPGHLLQPSGSSGARGRRGESA